MSARDDIDPLLLQAQDAGLRRAALALHSLALPDQTWMLARLPDDRRRVLNPLLQELAELGIPREAGGLALAAQGRATTQLEPAAALLSKNASKVARLLEGESAELIAGALSLGCAQWQESVRASLPATTIAQVDALTACGAVRPWPPRLADALLCRLDVLLKCSPASSEEVPQRAWILRMLDRMKARP